MIRRRTTAETVLADIANSETFRGSRVGKSIVTALGILATGAGGLSMFVAAQLQHLQGRSDDQQERTGQLSEQQDRLRQRAESNTAKAARLRAELARLDMKNRHQADRLSSRVAAAQGQASEAKKAAAKRPPQRVIVRQVAAPPPHAPAPTPKPTPKPPGPLGLPPLFPPGKDTQ